MLYARRTLKDEDGYMEAEINNYEMTTPSFTFSNSFGIFNNEEPVYVIVDKFIIDGKINIPERSLDTPLFNIMLDLNMPYERFKMPNYHGIYLPDSVHMISKTKEELKKNWNKYFKTVEENMKKYTEIFRNKGFRYHQV